MLKKLIPFFIGTTLIFAASPAKQGVTPSPVVIEHTQIMAQDYQHGGLVAKMARVRAANLELGPGALREDVTMSFPVILGSYTDRDDQDTVRSMLQQELFDGPWPTPTMAEHYAEMSYGQFHLLGNVYGWYELSREGAFYEGSQSEPYDNGFGNPPGGTGSFLQEALDLADLEVDFRQYDSDGPDGIPNSGDDDGYVDAAFFVHSGRGGEGGGPYIWSHRWVYSGWWGTAYTTNDTGANGLPIKINDYIMQPAVSTGSGLIEIGVFSHEFGHALGLPDLYDTDYSSNGIGSWCLMASGSWSTPSSPVHLSAWCKEMMGWITPQVLVENMDMFEFPAAATTPLAVKLWTHGEVGDFVSGYSHGQSVGYEYFLLENRQRYGTEQHLPGTGLIIWHIDNTQWGNSNENHRLVDVKPADGYFNGSSPGDAWPGTTDNRNFDYETTPAAIGWAGVNTEVAVLNISDDDSLMTADLEVHEVNPHINIIEMDIIDDNNDRIFEPGEGVEIWLYIENSGGPATNLTATLSHAGDAVDIIGDLVQFEPLNFMQSTFANDPFEFIISDSLTPQPVELQITFSSDEMVQSDPYDITLLLGMPQVAIIDDDGHIDDSQDFFPYYADALHANSTVYTSWDIAEDGLPELRWLQEVPKLVWFTGNQNMPLDAARMELIAQYLDGGGKLILSGQDIASSDLDVESFLQDYFHVSIIETDAATGYVYGNTDHAMMELSDRFTLGSSAAAGNQDHPDGMLALQGGEALFLYPYLNDMSAGVSVKNQTFSSIFLGFGLEGLSAFSGDADLARGEIIARMLTWLDLAATGIADEGSLKPEQVSLQGAYPNPFNPSVTLLTNAQADDQLSFEVYDLKGRRVDQIQAVGIPKMRWTPHSNIPAGVYFVGLSVNSMRTGELIKLTYLK